MDKDLKWLLLGMLGIILCIALFFISLGAFSAHMKKVGCEEFKAAHPEEQVFYSYASGCQVKHGDYWLRLR